MNNLLKLTLFTMFFSLSSHSCFAEDNHEAIKFIEGNIEQTFKVATDTSSSAEAKRTQLIAIFESIVDVPWMARFAIGPQWKALDTTQQDLYVKAYKEYLLRIYLPKFEKNHSKGYKILGIEDANQDQYIVHLLILQNPNEPKIKLDYRIKCTDSKCYIRDLIAEGVSLLASQRSDFSSVLSAKGFDGLINILEKKVAA